MKGIIDRITAFAREWRWALIVAAVLLLVGGTWWFGQGLTDTASTGAVGIFSALIGLALIPAGVAVLFLSLRLRDRIGGINWPRMRGKIQTDPLSSAIYAGAWVLAVALIVSSVLR